MVSYDNFVYKMRLHPVAKPCCNVTINDCSIRKYFWLKPEVIEIAFFQDDDAAGRQRSVIPDATAGQNGIPQTGLTGNRGVPESYHLRISHSL